MSEIMVVACFLILSGGAAILIRWRRSSLQPRRLALAIAATCVIAGMLGGAGQSVVAAIAVTPVAVVCCLLLQALPGRAR